MSQKSPPFDFFVFAFDASEKCLIYHFRSLQVEFLIRKTTKERGFGVRTATTLEDCVKQIQIQKTVVNTTTVSSRDKKSTATFIIVVLDLSSF